MRKIILILISMCFFGCMEPEKPKEKITFELQLINGNFVTESFIVDKGGTYSISIIEGVYYLVCTDCRVGKPMQFAFKGYAVRPGIIAFKIISKKDIYEQRPTN